MAGEKPGVRFNFVDVILAVVVVVLLAAGVYKLFFVNKVISAQNGEIEFQVLIEKETKAVVESFQEGHKVMDKELNVDLGAIVSSKILHNQYPVPTLDGRVVMADVPDKYDLVITIRTPAVVTDNNVTVSNREIKIGDKIKIKTNTSAAEGKINGLTVIKG